MPEPAEERDPLEVLAAEFIERQRSGQSPSIPEYAAQHPELAAQIEELFPAIAAMERLKVHNQQSSGARVSLGAGRLERLGDFRILGEIGRGGMGIVYEAFQESLGRHVAVKVLPRQSLLDPKQLQRFQREAQTAAKLHHTNIVPVFGVGEHEGFHYIVMQLIRGVGLDAILAKLQQESAPGAEPQGGQEAGSPPPARDRGGEVTGLLRAMMEGQFGQAQEFVPSAPEAADPGLPVRRESAPEAQRPSSPADALTEDLARDRDTMVNGSDAAAGPDPATAPIQPGGWRCGTAYWRSAAAIGLQVAEALHYAHGHHTLHRDIKPANLLLDSQHVVWISDFGLAKAMEQDNVTQAGAIVGTLRYMAPEQFSGQMDARSDIYGLGLTLYELLTLQPAFDDTGRSSLIWKITHDEPPRPRKLNPKIPRDFETIVLKAIAREPADRYQSAGDLARDLQCFLEDRPIRARRTPAVERLWRWARRNRAVASLSAVTLALLILVAVVASVGYVRTRAANVEEARQRKKAEATSALALEALDNIFHQFAPDRAVTPSGLTVVSATGDEVSVPVQPVLSKEAAALLEHMLVFYDRLAKQGGDDARFRRKVAEANRRVGDIRQRLGHSDQAKAAYLRAVEVYQDLAKTSPDDADLSVEIARLRNELGSVYGAANDSEAAHASHVEALATLKTVPAESSASPSYRYELARTYYLLGRSPGPGLWLPPPGPGGGRGKPPGPPGFGPGEKGLPKFARGGRRGPEGRGPDRPDRPNRPDGPPGPPDARGGKPFPGSGPPPPFGPWRESEDYLHKAADLLEGLVAEHPAAPDYRHLLARCYRDLPPGPPGRDPQPPGDTTGKATAILEKLVADFPDVPDYRYDLSETYARLDFRPLFPWPGEGETERKRVRDSAESRLRKALDISERLVAEHPNVPDYAVSQVQIRLGLADMLQGGGKTAEAEETLRKALALQSSLARRFPDTASYQLSLVMVHHRLAYALHKRGQSPEARSQLDASAKVLDELAMREAKLGRLRGAVGFSYMGLSGLLRLMGDEEAADAAFGKAEQFRPPPPPR
jgi:tetratricopeptide (TPR) repeat protein